MMISSDASLRTMHKGKRGTGKKENKPGKDVKTGPEFKIGPNGEYTLSFGDHEPVA
jgi:hypothetical protein